MYKKSDLQNLLVFDIETVPQYKSLNEMTDSIRKTWLEKYHYKAYDKEVEKRIKDYAILYGFEDLKDAKEDMIHEGLEKKLLPNFDEIFIKESGLYPEFAKVYCISFGVFDSSFKPVINTLWSESEDEMIEAFFTILGKRSELILSGYNINEFDIPFILKRFWINKMAKRVKYPLQFRLKDAKPWTVKREDHMANYKAGAWGNNIGLGLLCDIMGIPSPKDKFSNDQFTTLLLNGNITKEEAIEYCEKDVLRLMEVMLEFSSDTSNYGG